ncbi:hypothetical protein AQUCO_02200348v1 [Aquilegia coerulea]|uniref:Uncharacterized protein n=1 Tax=Aquilegia coerulea TaxID=218851 RepID=A0A2G5DEF1_AQUCA|nr:hypothetical protein AQUCO_02200348v1 [Aquilegia coerulea]
MPIQEMEHVNVQQDFEAFKAGLSDQCPPVIEKAIKKISSIADNLFLGAVLFKGWNGIGKNRILKYVAKRAVESKAFDVVIWMIEREKNVSTSRKFQRRVAEQLGVTFSKDDSDDEEEQTVDENVKGRIRANLEEKTFILVHNGHWELSQLVSMGIPIRQGAQNTMVLVASSDKNRRYHEVVSMEEDLSVEDVWDVVREECVAIVAEYPILRRAHHITPEVIMECIMFHYYLSYGGYLVNYSTRLWFSEGYFVGEELDLKTTFDHGQVLFEALCDHCILDKSTSRLSSELNGVTRRMAQSNGYSNKVLQVFPEDDHHILSPHSCSKLSVLIFYGRVKILENMFEHMINVRTLDLSYTNIRSLPSSMIHLVNLRLLHLRFCSCLDPFQLSPMKALKKIELLDLSQTSLKELPDDFFDGLQSLRLLDLSNCSKLLSLPSSMSFLTNLEHLSLHSCESLSCIPSSIQGLEKLQVLYLSKTKLATIPEQFFQNMYKLKVLDLSFNHLLKSIPMSFSNLVNCQKLNLESCESLQTITPWLGGQGSLPIEHLNLSSCSSLQDIDHVLSSCSTKFPNIRSLNLTNTSVSQLSLSCCSYLEILHLQSNTALEKLDLSATKIKNFLLDDYLNLVRLKHFVFHNMKPQGANNWGQCGDGSTPHMHIQPIKWRKDGNEDGVFVSVENANMFRTLTSSSTFWTRFLVYVCPCKERGKVIGLPLKKATLPYKDILSKFKHLIPSYERCLEIERVSKFPKAISGVLSHAHYLTLHDETAIVRLSDFGIENMQELRECFMQRCHASLG